MGEGSSSFVCMKGTAMADRLLQLVSERTQLMRRVVRPRFI